MKRTENSIEAQLETIAPNVESDSDEESIPEQLEMQEHTIVDDLRKVVYFLFGTNAFEVMEKEFFDFVFPSFRAIMMRWILKKHRAEEISDKQRRDLEVIASELQHIPAEDISISFESDYSIVNNIKGRWENFTGEIWDWRPLRPYKRPLASGEVRLQWKCVR